MCGLLPGFGLPLLVRWRPCLLPLLLFLLLFFLLCGTLCLPGRPGLARSLAVFPGLSGGVPCLFPRRSLLPLSVPPGSLSRPGRVPPWAFPSGPPGVPSLVLSLWSGSLPRWPPPGSPVPGRRAWVRLAGSVRFGPALLACRPAGWFRCRFPRRPCRFGGVALPAPSRPGSRRPAVFPLGRSGGGPFSVSRRRLPGGGRVLWWSAPVAGLPPAGGWRGVLGAGRWPFGGRWLCRWR